MAGAAHHTLLDKPRVGANLEHFEIVIRFEDQKIALAQMLLHVFGHVAEIRGKGGLCSVRTERKANRIDGIVRDHERIHFDVADFKALARPNVLNTLHFLERAGWKHLQDFAMRRLGKIRRAAPFARHLREASRMIGMLVRDEDCVDSFRAGAAERFEAAENLLAAQSCVNEESRVLCFEQRGVARAAGGQNGDAKRDAPFLRATRKIITRRNAGVKGNPQFPSESRYTTNWSRVREKPFREPTTLAARRSD